MKKVLLLFALLLMIPISINAQEKVKVYMFIAGDCPYCELEEEYLKTIDQDKIEVITKELYIDHVDWEPGKDYQLGVKVADAFTDAGFTDANYNATPFVIISDLYAATGYNADLEDVINYAYEEGDQDAVSCIEAGEEGCIRDIEDISFTSSNRKTPPVGVTKGSKTSAIISVGVILAVLVFFLLKKKK